MNTVTEGPGPVEVPRATHWWNFWVSGWEAAIFIAAAQMMGPMTLIPFLFKQTGIDQAWLGLFTISALIAALGGPLGAGWAGGREWKLPFCVKVGWLQRIPFLAVPLGVMFLFSSPLLLLIILVAAWVASNFFGGIGDPVYQAVLTNGIRENWWGRMQGMRNILGAIAGLATAVFVWWVNRRFPVPGNYIVLGWLAVAMLFVSLYVVSRFCEVPLRSGRHHGRETLAAATRRARDILRGDARVRWLVIARVFRSCGFVLGTYCTAVFIERCHLTEAQMWIPLTLICVSEIIAHMFGGWLVDRHGPKPAFVLSSILVFVNSLLLTQCHSMSAFILLFPSLSIGGSLLNSGWVTFIMRLPPAELRPAYLSTVSLASAPGSILTSLAGVLLVRLTGFEHVFYLSAIGGLISAVLFFFKLPNIRHAAAGLTNLTDPTDSTTSFLKTEPNRSTLNDR